MDGVERLKEIAEQQEASRPSELFVPGMGEDALALPNHINRSSLFAPIARGQRTFHRQTPMVTRGDCELLYTGEQLDEADSDLIMALIAFAQPFPLGAPVPLNRSDLLRKINRSTGKHDYEWLHRRIKAMTEATLFMEAKRPDGSTRYRIGKTVSFRIISAFSYDDETQEYTYTLDPRWVRLFSNREYALIDWEKRMQIHRGQDMAKALQRLVASSSNVVQTYSMEWLQAKMVYTSPARKFRDAVGRSCSELERLGIISGWSIEAGRYGEKLVIRTAVRSG